MVKPASEERIVKRFEEIYQEVVVRAGEDMKTNSKTHKASQEQLSREEAEIVEEFRKLWALRGDIEEYLRCYLVEATKGLK